ncbi:caffeoyl-CoA O-methyltransferase 1-like [Coffea arabica]|uniref:caffeoyl-CoA O-methyltransferase n=1 Tax=Coffea arabica TaxID=13443 RepID=A0ABM4URE5_COFAR
MYGREHYLQVNHFRPTNFAQKLLGQPLGPGRYTGWLGSLPARRSCKSLLQSDALYRYILEAGVYPREAESMQKVRQLTAEHQARNDMITPADEGQFLNMLIKLINAKNTMEIGVYTGYSLLPTVLALPQEGKVLQLDVDRESYELGLPIIEKACAAQTIDDFGEGPALPVLDEVIVDVMPKSSPPPTTVLLLCLLVKKHTIYVFKN